MISWCGKGQRVFIPEKREVGRSLVLYRKEIVQSVRNLHCTEAVGDEFGKEGRGKKMIRLGPVLELEL